MRNSTSPLRSAFRPLGELERLLGKPRSDWSGDDLVQVIRENDVRVLALMHVGGDGWLKTLDFVPRSVGHLRNILDGGERADGSSLFAGSGIPREASDIVLRPRVGSAFLDPFATLPTLVLLCGHTGRDGQPLAQSPDTILRRAHERMKRETGIELHALGEVEYFLGKRTDERDIYGAEERGYHATSPFVFGEDVRRRALATLADIGVPVKYGHAEVGYVEAREAQGVIWEQHEIELALLPLPDAADAILLTQWVLRNLAHRSGMRCSTDPMMLPGHAGNGLHFHLTATANGRPIDVRTAGGDLTESAQWLIGGLVRAGGALMAFGNRTEDSFARLRQGKEAPSTICWGEFDRQALIRLPVVVRAAGGRPLSPPTIEFRLPDGSALPHLLLAGVAQAAVRAREQGELEDTLRRTRSRYAAAHPEEPTQVPRNFAEVARALAEHAEDLERGGVFPPAFLESLAERLRS